MNDAHTSQLGSRRGCTGPRSPRIVLATHNAKKLRELERVLAEHLGDEARGLVVSSADLALPDVVEDGLTFADNAVLKARAAAHHSGLLAVADDSGLIVDVLGAAPGILSARWAGRHGDDTANNALLLAQLADIAPEHRGARFMCAAALAWPDGRAHVEIGEMRGTLLSAPRGAGGFGYDPLFVPEDPSAEGRTCAELTPQEKDQISHRGRALRALVGIVVSALREGPGL
ncbi:RdgB/HAM1 family non-canonical purine NTP pyrophosphatase [Devriesea agamarum]|uniref:RdgB/HAM1 family non-canonical purine NTP pyrophosphatase n=1 Tax=Devriesea agamarum TaxID=472569 RepID=UPI000A053200|nr:RdgB/HAM1 family non-canonical purine NTP pyrophosphatase [Devriesea agamarum]